MSGTWLRFARRPVSHHYRFADQGWNCSGYTRFPQDPHGSGADYEGCCYSGNSPWRPAPIHNGGTNSLFCDGHVKYYLTSKLVNPNRGAIDCLYDNGTP